MFKQQGGFWLYFFGIIIMFLIIFYIAESLMGKQPGASLFGSNPKVTVVPSKLKVTTTGKVNQTGNPTVTTVVGSDYYAVVITNKGEFKIELYEKSAPNTVANFINLSNSDFYDGTKFYKLVPGFVLQGGSNSDTSTGGPGYTIPDEINWDSLDYDEDLRIDLRQDGYKSIKRLASIPLERYTLSMVGAGPNTGGSQFYIILGNKNDDKVLALKGRSTVFARVVEGKEVVDKIAAVPIDNSGLYPKPTEDLVIQDIKIYVR